MKKLFIVGAVVLSLAGSASAITYTDVQTPGASISAWSTYSGTFDIVNPGSDSATIGGTTYSDFGGYTPGNPLSDVSVSFWFSDSAHILPNITFVVGLGSINLGIWGGTTETFSYEGTTGAINFLQKNGQIDYTIGSLLGTFTFNDAVLQASTVESQSESVPDGGMTLMLLGSSLIALIVVQKRLVVAKGN